MCEHVPNRFPHLAEEIRSLMKEDLTFREICTDYEEVCTWLAYNACPDGGTSEDTEHNLALKRDLEREIEEALLRQRPRREASKPGSNNE